MVRSQGRQQARSERVAGVGVGLAALPLQTNSMGAALCDLGLGGLITTALYLGGMLLMFLALGDLYGFFTSKRSKSSGSHQQGRSNAANAGMKMVGAIVVGGFPILADAAGISLLSCVDPVRFITGTIIIAPL